MKKLRVLLALCVCAFLFAACDTDASKSSATFSKESPYTDVCESEDVTLSLKEGSLEETRAVLLLENHTQKQMGYSHAFALEQQRDGVWYSFDRDMEFDALGIILEPQETAELSIDWGVKLPKGSYRIVKSVEGKDLAAEFTVD